jgi:hypothetical protein
MQDRALCRASGHHPCVTRSPTAARWRTAIKTVAATMTTAPSLWVPETVLTAVDLPLRHQPGPGMIRRWRCG